MEKEEKFIAKANKSASRVFIRLGDTNELIIKPLRFWQTIYKLDNKIHFSWLLFLLCTLYFAYPNTNVILYIILLHFCIFIVGSIAWWLFFPQIKVKINSDNSASLWIRRGNPYHVDRLHVCLYYRPYRDIFGFRNLFCGWVDISIDCKNRGFAMGFWRQLNHKDAAQVEIFLREFRIFTVGHIRDTYSYERLENKTYNDEVSIAKVRKSTTQIALLLESGIHSEFSIGIATGQVCDKTLRDMLIHIACELEGCVSWSEITDFMSKYPKIFPPFYTRTILQSEQDTNITTAFAKLSNCLKAIEKNRRNIAGMFRRFIVSWLVCNIVVTAITVTFFPTLLQAFGKAKIPLPLFVQWSPILIFISWFTFFLLLHVVYSLPRLIRKAYTYLTERTIVYEVLIIIFVMLLAMAVLPISGTILRKLAVVLPLCFMESSVFIYILLCIFFFLLLPITYLRSLINTVFSFILVKTPYVKDVVLYSSLLELVLKLNAMIDNKVEPHEALMLATTEIENDNIRRKFLLHITFLEKEPAAKFLEKSFSPIIEVIAFAQKNNPCVATQELTNYYKYALDEAIVPIDIMSRSTPLLCMIIVFLFVIFYILFPVALLIFHIH